MQRAGHVHCIIFSLNIDLTFLKIKFVRNNSAKIVPIKFGLHCNSTIKLRYIVIVRSIQFVGEI